MHRTVLVLGLVCLSAPAFAAGPERGNFVQRATGWFQPKAVRQVLREAKGAKGAEQHDAILKAFAAKHAGTLPVFSVVKLAKKTEGGNAHEAILSSYAHTHAGALSFGAMRDLVKRGTPSFIMRRPLATQVLAENERTLSPKQQRTLRRWATETPADRDSSSTAPTYGAGINGLGHITYGNQAFGGASIDLTTGQLNISVGPGMSITP